MGLAPRQHEMVVRISSATRHPGNVDKGDLIWKILGGCKGLMAGKELTKKKTRRTRKNDEMKAHRAFVHVIRDL